MIHLHAAPPPASPQTSPLLLSDRLIALAQDAERAGFRGTAAHLVDLACAVFDEVGAGAVRQMVGRAPPAC